MTLSNADEPATAATYDHLSASPEFEQYKGLTKREYFCIMMKVPKTGDEELDDIIREGNLRDSL